jgi:histidyl-tRNA synthetase
MTFQALPGFRDFPPDELAFRSHILAAWRRVARRYGFVEYDGPPLEPLELYAAKSGDEIVGQLFNFVDKGGREVAMRPEMTPTFARMVSHHAKSAPKPIRWFSVPQLFRYEKQQRGRLREHFQLNCDLVGESGPRADAEVIALAIDVCRELGLAAEDFKVRLSDRRVIYALLAHAMIEPASFEAVLGVIDKLERDGATASRARLVELGLGDRAEAVLAVAAIKSATALNELAEGWGLTAVAWEFTAVLEALDAMGLSDFIEVDFSIVRGLAYYTGTVFELFDRQARLRAICGGGRYDNLLESLGGADLPAVGFGMGDVVLGELLKDRGLRPTAPAAIDCFVVAVTADDMAEVLRQAHRLREAGLAVEYSLDPGDPKVGKQLKLAGSRGARLAVLIGPDDRAVGQAQLKDLTVRTQLAVPLDDLVARCRDILTSTD